MGSFTDRISVYVDVITDKATTGLGNLKQQVSQTEGSFNKLKVGAGGVFDGLAANGPAALTAVGTAAVAFVGNAIGDFQSLALQVDNFTQKTGVSADAASRWIEVGNDLGVSADGIATAFGKFERADAAGSLAKYGLQAQGASDRMAELIGKIGAIPDENQRATAAFEVFGKSWQAISPLIDSTEDLRDRMAEVADGQLISEDDISQARSFRDNMDEVNDAMAGFVRWVGDEAVGAINKLVKQVKDLGGPLGEIKTKVDDLDDSSGGFLSKAGQAMVDFGKAFVNPLDQADRLSSGLDTLGHATEDLGTGLISGFGLWGDWSAGAEQAEGKATSFGNSIRAMQVDEREAAAAITAAADALAAEKKATEETTAALDGLNKMRDQALEVLARQQEAALGLIDSEVGYKRSVEDVGTALGNYQTAAGEAETATREHGAASDEATKAQQALDGSSRSLEDSISKTRAQAVLYAQDQAEASGATFTTEDSINAQIGALQALKAKYPELAGAIDAHIAKLDAIPTTKNTDVTVQTAEAAANLQAIIDKMGQIRDKTVHVNAVGGVNVAGTEAQGGPIDTSGIYLVGEEGPELVTLQDGSYVHTASETAKMLGVSGMADGGLVGGSPATRAPSAQGRTLHDLFGPGGRYESRSDDPLRKLFGRGTDFANWTVTGGQQGQWNGWRLINMFGPGSDFYRMGADADEILFGTGADFANLTAAETRPTEPTVALNPPSASGSSTPSRPPPTMSMGDGSFINGVFSSKPPTKSTGDGVVVDGVFYSTPPSTAPPSSGSSSFAGAGGAGGGGGGGDLIYNVTNNFNMPPGTNADDVVNKLKEWTRRNGPLPRSITGSAA